MMCKNPLVSIITPAYNCESTIENTYNSLREQTYTNWEWLITEDCSSDKSYEKLLQLSKTDDRIRVFQNAVNLGAAVSRNNSISHAKGDFLAFIDSDDLWERDKLEQQLAYMMESDIDFSFTAYELINKYGVSLGKLVDSKQKQPLSYRDMLKKKATLGCSTVMLRVNAFDCIEMPLIRTGQDYGLWLSLLKTGKLAYPLTKPLTKYRLMPNSISRNKIKKAKRQWQIYREIEHLNLFTTIHCFCFYAWRAVFRR